MDSLAGRAATPEDARAYEALLSAHCREAGRRATLMALAPHGLTERRLARLVDAYERRFPAVQALRRQWEDFFRGDKYRKTIRYFWLRCGGLRCAWLLAAYRVSYQSLPLALLFSFTKHANTFMHPSLPYFDDEFLIAVCLLILHMESMCGTISPRPIPYVATSSTRW